MNFSSYPRSSDSPARIPGSEIPYIRSKTGGS